jgi:hypothetical protein
MRRTLVALVTVAIIVCLTASVAVAGMRINRISFSAVSTFDGGITTLSKSSSESMVTAKRGNGGNSQELCAGTCAGLLLHAEGTLVGLGSTDSTVVIEATGVPVVTCTNQGGTQAPGQNPSSIATSGEQQIGITQITKNGSAQIDVTTELPVVNLPASLMGCANDNWTASIVGIQFTTATVSVFQGGTLELQQTFVF